MARIPSKQDILDWISDNPGAAAKRDIAKAFGLKGAERIELKRMLKELGGSSAGLLGRLLTETQNALRPGVCSTWLSVLPSSFK